MHQDEGVGGEHNRRLKHFARMGERLIHTALADGATLINCCLTFRRTTRSHSRSRKRISEQRSAIISGLSMARG